MAIENYKNLVVGSGEGGKYLAWHLARAGERAVVVERRRIGGSCPNVNGLPSKNEIWSAKAADLAQEAIRTMATGKADAGRGARRDLPAEAVRLRLTNALRSLST
jgi:pyruvate/2-oxoglutarate dehydrogenase complex dihydrolipoamide dehydrogenase (E3) component